MSRKTSVSLLQEYLVSKKELPQYELTRPKEGTQVPEFTYRVKVGKLCEEATGRSLKEAKHGAAEKMLKTLKVTDASMEEEETSELSKKPMDNYVGKLKDLCLTLHYPDPKYYLEEESGPPHSRTFKMICCVSQLQEFGISKTKKQAKHKAAAKMIECLKAVGGKKTDDALANLETPNRILSSSVTDEEVIEKYNAQKMINVSTTKDNAALYKDNHMAYIGLCKTSPTLTKVLKGSKVYHTESSLSLMKEIANELGAELETVETPTTTTEKNFTIMTMSLFPPIGGVGLDENNAAFNLLDSLLVLCKE